MATEADLARLGEIAMRASSFRELSRINDEVPESPAHPFNERNIYSDLPAKVQRLFDDGHYAEATFEACKYLEREVKAASGLSESGRTLMMRAFAEDNPKIALNSLTTVSEKDEQEGFKFLFAGAVVGIRNPRGHDSPVDTPQECLDYLGLVSLLLRRLRSAGYQPCRR